MQAGDAAPFYQGPAEEERIGRFVVQAASAPAITTTAGLAAAGAVVIVDDEHGVGEELAGALARAGRDRRARLAPASGQRTRSRRCALAARMREHGGAKALVHLAALGDGPSDYGAAHDAAAARAGAARGPGGGGRAPAARRSSARAASAARSASDGARPAGAAPAGGDSRLPQDASRRSGRRCGSSPSTCRRCRPRSQPRTLLAELAAADGLVEVGYRERERTQLTLAAGAAGRAPRRPRRSTRSACCS